MGSYAAHRKYCNYVKKELLNEAVSRVATPTPSLLDMCCGRGGDIFKWDTLGIRRVYGLDSDTSSVMEAIRRYKEYRRKMVREKRAPIIVNFHVQSALSSGYIRDTILRGQKVNIVSCMFALHYFNDLRVFLRIVSDNLIPGGFFVGVAPDSTYIKKLLDPDDPYKNDEVIVRWADSSYDAERQKEVQAAYYFLIKGAEGTSEGADYFSFRGESLEYLIDKDELVSLAREEGLELVEMKNISTRSVPSAAVYGTFGSEASGISQLYFSFIFCRKC